VRAVVVLGVLAACGRQGFDDRIDANVAPDAADDAPSPDAGPPAWKAFNPIGYYAFDGDAADQASTGGTFACAGCTFMAGHHDQGVLAPVLNVPNHSVGGPDFTVTLWVYVPSVFPGTLAGCGTYHTARVNMEADDEPARFVLFSSTGNLSSPPGTAITGDAWTHVAITSNATTKAETLFVNGVQIGSGTETVVDTLQGSRIGGDQCAVLLDELFVFDRVLTTSEIASVRDL